MSSVVSGASAGFVRQYVLRSRTGYAALVLLSYVPVLLSAPGRVAADTKQYLYLDPGRVLERAWSMWDPNIGLGTVTHQNIGYLFPLGPFYWLFENVGVPDWVAQRLWLGSLIFVAGLGMLALFRTIGLRGSGAVVGTLAYAFSPYILDYAARISVILLPWAGLPWLLVLVIRGLRTGGWWHAAWFAVVVQIIGGVNATALLFAGIAPFVWVLHSVAVTREVTIRRAMGTVGRIGVLTMAASTWWMAGLWAQGAYGINILKYTETLRAVSRTSLPNEVLRGLGYWFFYGRDKLGSWIEASPDYTQRPVLILVSYGIPVLALLGFAVLRWRYRSYFATLVVIGTVIAVAAHPYDSPTPIGTWFRDVAASSTAAFALRSTGRATPLVVLGMAGLLAGGVTVAVRWLGERRWRRVPLGAAASVVVGALVLINLPALWNDTFYGGNLQRDEEVPEYWTEAAAELDRRRHDTRVMELPGADFASYRWGNTVDPITPGLMDRPYVARELIPYGSPTSANLLNAFDLRIQERSLPPSALAAMARLLGVGDYVLRNDIQFERYRVLRPEFLAELFTPTPGGLEPPREFGTPDRGFTSLYPFQDEQALATGRAQPVPAPIEAFAVRRPGPIVRSQQAGAPVVMAGDGDGIVDLAALGTLDASVPVLTAASLDRTALRAAVRTEGAALVVTDTNRERARRWSTVTDTLGYTEGPGNHPIRVDESDSRLEEFPDAPRSASTRVVLRGVRRVGATSYGNPITYTPEDRAARAFDGDVWTAWRTGAFSDVRGERILVETLEPVRTDRVNLVQVMRPPRERWITKAVLRFDGGDPVTVDLAPSSRTAEGQTVRFPSRRFRTLSIEIRATNLGQLRSYGGIDPVGFAEIRLRGEGRADPVRIEEITVLPTDLVTAAGAQSARHPLTYTMRRDRVIPVPPRRDPERSMTRQIEVPTARAFGVGAEIRLSPWAPDETIDRVLGYRGSVTASATDRLPGSPAARASAALDHDLATAWQTPFDKVTGQRISVAVARPRAVDRLDLAVVTDGRHSVPRRLILRSDSGEQRRIDLPKLADSPQWGATTAVPVTFAPLRGRTFSVEIAEVREVLTREWYCECDLRMPVGIAELGMPDLAPIRVADRIPAECRSDLVALDGRPVRGRIVGSSRRALELGELRFQSCGLTRRPAVRLAAGPHVATTTVGESSGWNVDQLVLASDAGGRATALGEGSRVRVTNRPERGVAPKVRMVSSGRWSTRVELSDVRESFWLVLGQSANPGWEATVDGDDAGAPTLINGYANGWRIEPSDQPGPITVELEWAPQRVVNAALGVSVAALVVIALILITAGSRRRRARVVPGIGPASVEAPIGAVWSEGVAIGRPGSVRSFLAVLVTVGFGALAVAPWVGAVAAALVAAALRWPRVRRALRFGPALALAGCGAFIAAKQVYARFPSAFEWPTFFAEIRTLGWFAVVLVVATLAVDAAFGGPEPVADEPVAGDQNEAVRP